MLNILHLIKYFYPLTVLSYYFRFCLFYSKNKWTRKRNDFQKISNHSYLNSRNKSIHQIDDHDNNNSSSTSLEDFVMDTSICTVCCKDERDEDVLICDGCDKASHYYCVNLPNMPSGDWFCRKCKSNGIILFFIFLITLSS